MGSEGVGSEGVGREGVGSEGVGSEGLRNEGMRGGKQEGGMSYQLVITNGVSSAIIYSGITQKNVKRKIYEPLYFSLYIYLFLL